jgi:hypothetical protein
VLTPNKPEFERLIKAAVAYCEHQLHAMADPTQLDTTPWDGTMMHSVEHYESLLSRLQGPEGAQNNGKGQDGAKPQHRHESFLPHHDHAHQPSSGDQQCDAAHPKDDLPHATSPPALHPEQQALKDAHKMEPTAEEVAHAERVHALSTALGGVTILFKVCNFRCNSRNSLLYISS